MAVTKMVVDDTERLHRRVDGSGPDEPKPEPAQLGGQFFRLWRRRLQVGAVAPRHFISPNQAGHRGPLRSQLDHGPRVANSRLYFGPMTDDRGVREQPLDIGLAELGHHLRVETGKSLSESLSFAQDS